MREIVMDTETTGLDPNSGDRIVEIGAVELFNHMPTGKTYHQNSGQLLSVAFNQNTVSWFKHYSIELLDLKSYL